MKLITYGSLFSGCGLMDLGLCQAGLSPRWLCEIDPDARRVLAAHHPDIPCHEDVRTVGRHNLEPVDLIVGGFPCQDLSVAGKRAGIQGGERSGLWWEMLRVIDELRPCVIMWENVPGLFSSDTGRDIRRVCSSLAEHDYFGCVRTLDARYFGVPQRRRRLFGVFVRGDPTAGRAAQILALAESRSGHPPTRGEAGADLAATLRSRSHSPGQNPPGRGGEDDQNLIVAATLNNGDHRGGFRTEPGEHLVVGGLTAHYGKGADSDATATLVFTELGEGHQTYQETEVASGLRTSKGGGGTKANLVTHSLSASCGATEDGTGRGTPIAVQPIPLDMRQASRGETMTNNCGESACSGGAPGTGVGEIVRRLTPTECLRLMGAPDSFLDIDPPLSDSAKYRLIGNGVVVSVARWLGRRILREIAT